MGPHDTIVQEDGWDVIMPVAPVEFFHDFSRFGEPT